MELKIECTNGYTIENLRLEGKKILVECYPKKTTDRIFCKVMAAHIVQNFEESTGTDVKQKDIDILINLIGNWGENIPLIDEES